MWKRGEKESTEKVLEKEGFLSWSLYSPLNGWIIQEGGWVKSCLGVWPEEEEMKKIIRLAWMRLVPLNFSLKVENSFLLSLHLSLSNYHSPTIICEVSSIGDWIGDVQTYWYKMIELISTQRGEVEWRAFPLYSKCINIFSKKCIFLSPPNIFQKACPSPPLASISSSLLS